MADSQIDRGKNYPFMDRVQTAVERSADIDI